MIPADLHVHSRYSDGLLSPAALCALALQRRMETLALCDHDTTDGLIPMAQAAAACNRAGTRLTVFPAIELSTGSDGHTHVLGYGIDPNFEPLQTVIAALRAKRQARGLQMLEALRVLGVELPADALAGADMPSVAVGRPHVARALIRAGVVRTVEEAFDHYLDEGRPAYVPLEHISAADAVTLLSAAGAVPVLAHPARLRLTPQALEALILSLAERGLRGVEVYHPSASRRDLRTLDGIAKRNGLLVTGGSDFHGDPGSRVELGETPGGWRSWKADTEALAEAMAERRASVAPD